MSVIERVWGAAHGWSWFPRWELFQIAAVIVGGILVSRRSRLVRPYVAGVVFAVLGALLLGGGAEWGAWFAAGARGPAPEVEIAGFGAIGGLVVAYVVVARGSGTRPWRALDALAPAIGAMVAVARLGCFFAGCDFGTPTSLPWALRYPHFTPAFRAQLAQHLIDVRAPTTLGVHPTQLYESLAGIGALAAALVWPRARGRRVRSGERFLVALVTYAAGRFAIDFVRGDLARGGLGLTVTQCLAVAFVGIAVAAWAATPRPSRGVVPRRDDPPSSPESRRSSHPTAVS